VMCQHLPLLSACSDRSAISLSFLFL
jgi:hypothetical protein